MHLSKYPHQINHLPSFESFQFAVKYSTPNYLIQWIISHSSIIPYFPHSPNTIQSSTHTLSHLNLILLSLLQILPHNPFKLSFWFT